MKFRVSMENHMPMTVKRSNNEIKFQYGGRLFSENGSSNISSMDWNIWSKFGTPIALGPSEMSNVAKPAVDLRRYGRHLVKSILRHNSVLDHPNCTKFGKPLQNHMPMTANWWKLKPEVNFQYGGRLFSETGSSNISVMDCHIWSKFGMLIALDIFFKMPHMAKREMEVDLRRYGRHLIKSIWLHNSVGDHPICINVGRPLQNHMPITVKRSKLKPEVEF